MARCALALALVAAVLCVALAAPLDEEAGGLGCQNALKKVERKAKDIVKKGQKIENLPEKTERKIVQCLAQAAVPPLATLCVQNIANSDQNTLQLNGQLIGQDLQQLTKQLGKLAQKCLGGAGGGK